MSKRDWHHKSLLHQGSQGLASCSDISFDQAFIRRRMCPSMISKRLMKSRFCPSQLLSREISANLWLIVSKLVRRCSRLVSPDTSILRQLVPSSKSTSSKRFYNPPESDEIINNAILRKHFRQLTEHFLRPFDQYFGIWKAKRVTSVCLYQDIEECMKPFDKTDFIQSINPQTLPICIRRSKWKQLYLQFIDSPHFDPWFMYRRQLCIRHFDTVMRALRGKIDQEALTRTPCGKHQDLESCADLFNEVQDALDKEESRQERDEEQLATIQNHLKIIGNQIDYLKNTEL
uniref:Uncharacterized protein AlNc14C53G4091 n=1 Tax=Albugo laibachii Nc14 TaxID=890382 RepID=F0WBQ0_9STRA|nr:conserved hypothetical protein [Albugo laibachii Nc14]CCA20534.1 conserved hypothetical protein [Albugo laibachii Nc14]|eukprot:CCA20534.1 conserved hypothetical protein [Albugo laibachii Nc14]